VLACVRADGATVPPMFCWDTKRTKGEWLKLAACRTYHNGTGTGWSSSEIFKDWMVNVFVKHEKPLERGGVVLFIDGSSTHLQADSFVLLVSMVSPL
jgi:hypothetical protein